MNFNFGDSLTKTTPGFSLTSTPPSTTAAAASRLTLGSGDIGTAKLPQPLSTAPALSTATSTVSGLQLGFTTQKPATSTATSTTGTVGFSLSAPSSISFTGLATTSLTTTTTVTSTAALAASSAPQSILATTTVVSSAPSGTSTSLNFCQLEEGINKWTLELEEQEKVFMNQASQVNAWDRLLIANGEKIVNLNNAVERVKLEQQQLDHELDFILAQQRELEDCLAPLEKELGSSAVTDPEREHTYQLAENLDTQLKQMSEDLKEVIEHLNESNRTQDNNDPIVQIGRILNAHMNSLQWIDQNTTLIGTHLDQVAKLHDVHRRENERSFHLTYN